MDLYELVFSSKFVTEDSPHYPLGSKWLVRYSKFSFLKPNLKLSRGFKSEAWGHNPRSINAETQILVSRIHGYCYHESWIFQGSCYHRMAVNLKDWMNTMSNGSTDLQSQFCILINNRFCPQVSRYLVLHFCLRLRWSFVLPTFVLLLHRLVIDQLVRVNRK